jgi:hypothetical protein
MKAMPGGAAFGRLPLWLAIRIPFSPADLSAD